MRKILSVVTILVFICVMAGQAVCADSKGKEDTSLSGKVVETMNSGGYTYACIEKNGKKTWVAVPQTKIVKGQKVSFQPGIEMRNFESKTLKRKFDSIIFSGGVIK